MDTLFECPYNKDFVKFGGGYIGVPLSRRFQFTGFLRIGGPCFRNPL